MPPNKPESLWPKTLTLSKKIWWKISTWGSGGILTFQITKQYSHGVINLTLWSFRTTVFLISQIYLFFMVRAKSVICFVCVDFFVLRLPRNRQETYNCPSWIRGRETMTVENISWSISTKEYCRPQWGVEPATSRSPVGRRIQLSHRGRAVICS